MTKSEARKKDDSGDEYKRKATVASWSYLGLISVVALWQVFHHGSPDDWLNATKLNSLGDFLAGVFAPIAFIWVAVAVFIQSKELSLQRDELALTREEFAATRGVIEEQATAAREQVRAAEDQFALARASTNANWKLSLFDTRIKIYNELIELSRDLASNGPVDIDLMVRIGDLANRMKFVFGSGFQTWIKDIQADIDEARAREAEWQHFNKIVQRAEAVTADHEALKKAFDAMSTVEDQIREKLSRKAIEERFDSYLVLPDVISTRARGFR